MTEPLLKGAKGGSSSSFKQTPDTLRSDDTFEGVLGVAIGPLKGPTRGLKSIKIDDTAIENESGERNLGDFLAEIGDGDPAAFPQRISLKLGSAGAPTPVNLTITNSNPSSPGPWITKTLPNTGAGFIDLRFIVSQLYHQTKKGVFETNLTLDIEMKPTSASTWVDPTAATPTSTYDEQGLLIDDGFGGIIKLLLLRDYFDGAGNWNSAGGNAGGTLGANGFIIRGKTTTPSVYELRVAVPNTDAYEDVAWDVRVRLREKDTVDTSDASNDYRRIVAWESLAAVYSSVLGEHEDWRGVAWLHVYGKASEQLTGVPEITGIWDTKIVSVPPDTVFNPETRAYTGTLWDGSWAKAFTTDPAWIINDAITDSLSGLSLIAAGSYLNKWDALEASKWCSELVPDGHGGEHPRFCLNLAVQEPQKAEDFIRYLAGAVGGLAWDQGNGEWRLKMDKPELPMDIFTLETIEGEFVYSHTDVDTRYNDITMAFKNEDMDYREDRVRVFDNAHIAQYGRKPLTAVAVGCTNRQEALRRAKLRLESTTGETRIVNFTTNRRGRNLEPLACILIADGDLGDRQQRSTGRTIAVAPDRLSITLRDTVRLEVGVDYTLHFSSPNAEYDPDTATQPTDATWRMPTIAQTREITNTSGQRGNVTVLYLDTALPADIPDNLAISLEATDLPTLPKMYRVLSIVGDDNQPERVGISALEVNVDKWDNADGVTNEDTVFQDLRGPPPAPLAPPGGTILDILEIPSPNGYIHTLTANWVRPPNSYVSGFRVRYRENGGAWKTVAERTQYTSIDIVNPAQAEYEVEIVTIGRDGTVSLPLTDSIEVNTSVSIPPTAYLTNESHTVAADVSGTVSSFVGAGGVFVLQNAMGQISDDVVFSVVSETGVDVTIDPDTGVYIVTSMSADQGTAVFRATYEGWQLDRTYSIAKSKGGNAGTNQWTPNLVGMARVGNVFTKTGASGAFDASVYSTERFTGAYASIKPSQNNKNLVAGFSQNPTTNTGVTSMQQYLWLKGDGTYETESSPNLGSYTTSDVFNIEHRGSLLSLTKNGVQVWTWPVSPTDSFFLDSSFYENGAAAEITFGARGTGAKIITVTPDKQTVNYTSGDSLSPSATTINFAVDMQNLAGATYTISLYRLDGVQINANTYLTATGSSASSNNMLVPVANDFTMTPANFDTARGSTQGVIVTVTLDGVSDKTSIHKVKDGKLGSDWTPIYTDAAAYRDYGGGTFEMLSGTWATKEFRASNPMLRGGRVSYKVTGTGEAMVGLHASPTRDTGFSPWVSLNFGWHSNGPTAFAVNQYSSPTYPGNPVLQTAYAVAVGDVLEIIYRETSSTTAVAEWYVNSVLKQTANVPIIPTLYAIGMGSSVGAIISEMRVGSQGASGKNAIVPYLTNEMHTVPADAAGNVLAYAGATGTFKVFFGTDDVSSSFTLSTVSNPQSLTVNYSSQTYTVTAGLDAAEDVGLLTIRATGSGAYAGVFVDKIFTLAKSKAGSGNWTPVHKNGNTTSYKPGGIKKTGGGSSWTDAGFYSAEAYRNPQMSFRVPSITTPRYMIGVNSDPGALNYSHLDFAFYLDGGNVRIYESNNDRGQWTTVVAGDKLLMAPLNGYMAYYKVGVSSPFYVSTVPLDPAINYTLEGEIFWLNDALDDITFGQAGAIVGQWTPSYVGMMPESATKFVKNNGITAWDATVRSLESFNGAVVRFRAINATSNFMIALNDSDVATNSYETLSAAIYLRSDGIAQIYTQSSPGPTLGSYTSATQWSIEHRGDTIVAVKDGVIVYTWTGVSPDSVWFLDSSFHTATGGVQDLTFSSRGLGGPVIALTSDAEGFTFVDSVATPSSQSITFTVTKQNTTENVTWSTSPSVTLTGSGNSRTLSLANFGTNRQVVVTATGDSGAKDQITVVRLERTTPGGLARNMLRMDQWKIGGDQYNIPYTEGGLQDLYPATGESSWLVTAGPDGSQEVVWKCNGVTANGAVDGGWLAAARVDAADGFDHKKSYMLGAWVYQPSTTSNPGGYSYFGCDGDYTKNLDGSANVNPYFMPGSYAGGPVSTKDKWFLWIGVIHGSGYTGADTGIAGVYDSNGVQLYDGFEFKSAVDSPYNGHRLFAYPGSINGNLMYFARPFFIELGQITVNEIIASTKTAAQEANADLTRVLTPAANQVIQYDSTGTTSSQLPKYLSNTLFAGGDNVTGIATWGFTASGCTIDTIGATAGQCRLTAVSSANASTTVTATYLGVQRTATISIQRVLAAAPPPPPPPAGGGFSSSFSTDVNANITDTSYDGSPQPLNPTNGQIRSNASGQIRFTLNAEYQAQTGSPFVDRVAGVIAKAQVSTNGTTWSDAGVSATGTTSHAGYWVDVNANTMIDGDDYFVPGNVGTISANTLQGGFTANTDYYVRWIAYKSGDDATVGVTGTISGAQS